MSVMLDPSGLRLLHEVARTGSYTAAARVLGYSQPAVSYKMRMLERQAGVALVVRVGRGMQLTLAGETLADHAASVLAALNAAEEAMAEIKGTRAGRVRIAAFQSACAVLLPGVIAALRRELPQVEVSLVGAEPPESLALVRGGDADIAVTFGFDDDLPDDPLVRDAAGLTRIPLMSDYVFVQLPIEHPLADRHTVQLKALAEEHWVVGSLKNQDKLRRACAAEGFVPTITTTADDNLAQEALVANRLGISLQPGLLTTLHHDERIVNRRLDPWPARRISALIWPDMARIPAVGHVLNALRATSNDQQRRFRPGDAAGAIP